MENIKFVICDFGDHVVRKSICVKGRNMCKDCYKTYRKKYAKRYYDKHLKVTPKTSLPKTRICIDCNKRKRIEQFHFQKPPYKCKLKERNYLNRRHDCKECQGRKSRAAYVKRTTKEERKVYMRQYRRNYDKNAPLGFRVAI